jgi:hypothetical protein
MGQLDARHSAVTAGGVIMSVALARAVGSLPRVRATRR